MPALTTGNDFGTAVLVLFVATAFLCSFALGGSGDGEEAGGDGDGGGDGGGD